MKRTSMWIMLLVLLISYAIPSQAAPKAAPLFQGDSVSGSYGDPNDLYLSFTVSGADFSQDLDGPPRVEGRYTGAPIHLAGKMIVSRAEGYVSSVRMNAHLGDQSVQWPQEGEDNAVSGRTVELPFDFTFQVPPDYEGSAVMGSAFVEACGGVCGSYAIDITIELPSATPTPAAPPTSTAIPTPTPLPQPKPPCDDPLFFYPGLNLNDYFTGKPALRYSVQEMKDDVLAGLQRFINEGNTLSSGARISDPYFIPKSYANSVLPTGKEAALQDAARQMARAKQQSDPNYRLTPGDLFYLSLKHNNGNIRDALLTCHAALYRDGNKVNKKFIEQENILTPLRNPEGYVDRETSYTTPQGSRRSINPFRELGHDEQGPWYHFFGLMAVEFTDPYGSASFHAAWLAIDKFEALQANYTDIVLAPDFPKEKLGYSLGKLAIALEHNIRTNAGKPPDIAKYCVNYYAQAAGSALKQALQEHLHQQRVIKAANKFPPLDNPGDILKPTGVVIYKSPLSILIQGTNGEWFSFDQSEGLVDGNTPLIYFELFPEEDGTLSFIGVPFFQVASLQMTGVGEGPVTLGLYDHTGEESNVFTFDVSDGDQILVEGWSGDPLLNGSPLPEIEQTEEILPGLVPGNFLGLLLIIGGGGLIVLLAGVGLAVFLSVGRRRPPQPTPPPAHVAVSPAPAPRPADAEATVISGALGSTWQLAVESGPNVGHRYLLGPKTRLGRNSDNEIRLNDSQTSRYHAVLHHQQNGYILQDLNSSNGIFVNGTRIGQPTLLQPGDVIQIGQTRFRVIRF
ncbi:MAG: FHA domain-containing protein [Anaerolineae bacterium]|nr:FHA domain-containing protein [Anaerolineae bacterium]